MLLQTKPTVTLPDLYTSRPATMEDLNGVVNLLNANSIALIGVADVTKNEIRTFWTAPKFEIGNSTRVVCTESGKIVGYSDIEDTSSVPVHPFVWGCVHPEYTGQGIGSYLFNWAESRAYQVIDRVPLHARVAARTYSLSTDIETQQLYEANGFQIIRHFLRMEVTLNNKPHPSQLPDGIKIVTKAEFDDLWPIFLAFDESFKDHWGHVERPLEEEFEEWKYENANDDKHDPTLWFLAMEEDEITAVCLCKPSSDEDPDMGWVNIIGVRPAWRRQGIGLALLNHSFQEFYKRGKQKVGLGVDADSLTGATKLYEKAGMKQTRQSDTYEKELRSGEDLGKRS